MGKIPSATTLSSIAYLTETGRRLLYGKDDSGNQIRFDENNVDNFEIVSFGLFDGDRNYKVAPNFTTGEMPDIAGTSDNTCLKTASDLLRSSSVFYQGEIMNTDYPDFKYTVNPENPIIDIDKL